MKVFSTLNSLAGESLSVADCLLILALTPVPRSVMLFSLAAVVPTTRAAIDKDLFKNKNESIALITYQDCPKAGPLTMLKYFTPMISKETNLWYLRDHQNIRGMKFVIQVKDLENVTENASRVWMTVGSVPSVSSTTVKKQGTAVFHMTVHGDGEPMPTEVKIPNKETTCQHLFKTRKQYLTDVKVFWEV
jgi:hypothetical protein